LAEVTTSSDIVTYGFASGSMPYTIVTPVMTVYQAGLVNSCIQIGNRRRSTNVLCHIDF